MLLKYTIEIEVDPPANPHAIRRRIKDIVWDEIVFAKSVRVDDDLTEEEDEKQWITSQI